MPGLSRRGNVRQFRVRVPDELRTTIGKGEIVEPLGAVSHAEAAWLARIERLAEAGVLPSVGSLGDSWDRALAETINGLYDAEVIHRCGPWRSFEAVWSATLEWVDWFNNRRLLEPIGNIAPAEAEQRWWDEQEQAAIAA